MPTGKLHIVPLGGLGEFGMNCMAVRWGDDIIVIDAGLMFPRPSCWAWTSWFRTFPISSKTGNVCAPSFSPMATRITSALCRGFFPELNVPVWGTEFTLALLEDKLEEHGLLEGADLREIRPGERFKAGPFTIHPIHVTHSLVDCVSLAIHTRCGRPHSHRRFQGRSHSYRQQDVRPACLCAEYGKEGVLALLQDSTNVERKGYTPSERAVRRKFDEVFAHTKRRLFISCFSSSIHRIKLAVELAWQHGRKVAFVGRSMTNTSEIAEDLGYIEIPEGLLIHPGDMKNYPPEKVCVMISGTQGEPM